jgi:hypothetical protein
MFNKVKQRPCSSPPAPKAPKRVIRMDRSASLVQLQLEVSCSPGRASKVGSGRGNLHICTFCISAQRRPNAPFRSDMAATSAPLGANFGQQGPNFGPTWLQDGAAWPLVGLRPKLTSTWAQHERHGHGVSPDSTWREARQGAQVGPCST